ncbi:capsid [Shanivirus waseris]|uniref:Capsid n=1 Tax=uncultured virus TaxID=340016 RepID=A0A2K9LS07_9VIRU|nr:capsid [uncultured virus]
MATYRRKATRFVKKNAKKGYGKFKKYAGYAIGAIGSAYGGYNNYKSVTKKPRKPRGKLRIKASYRWGTQPTYHSGINVRSAVVRGRFVPNQKKASGHINYQYTNFALVSSTAGKQNVTALAAIGTVSQLVSNVTIGTDVAYYQSRKAWLDMNPNQYNSKGVLVVNATSVDDAIILNGATSIVDLSNTESAGVYADLYCLTCKKTVAYGPETCWANGLTIQAEGVTAMTYAGAGDAGGMVAGTGDVLVPESKPQSVREFNQFWKVNKVVPIRLAGGASEKIRIHWKNQKIYRRATLTDQQALNQIFLPGCNALMLIQRGQLVVDDTTDATTHQKVTYASTKIAVSVMNKVYLRALKDGPGHMDFQYVYDNIPTGATAANQHIINEVDVDAAIQVL